ncbi:aminotransferase class I/II-fold pyridoxal phosphate-dependent enzyme [Umezawaea beigongshangensis]|uniref:aminotransferase class I/II-fold pyridoxal phosphate-dependent enzyme n=1 Tax=Umezawaea beigongshangensis TaxID=2780383 RepID=UPI0018F26124|nr:aminotransferase class I/II-fold pyridoxal phosphate-dependent enzyme [Umezawaea beigongshangensis]
MGVQSHTRRWRRGVVQDVAPEGVVDLGPGYLDPAVLPVALLREAYAVAFAEYGAAALSYGHDSGALDLRAPLAARAGCDVDEVVITAGTSQALHLLATALARPGDTVLVERQGYDFGQRILTDCGLRTRAVPGDASGITPEALEEELAGVRPAFLYVQPTFHNPTGRVVPESRRRELLAVARRHGLLVVEDDAYGELRLGPDPVPPPLSELAGNRGVVRLCSFSKVLGPGLRVGWLIAEPELAAELTAHGLFVSGGCVNHTTSLAVATLLNGGAYDRHLADLRVRLRTRRDALLGALPAPVTAPGGGFFAWLPAPPGHREVHLLAAAARAGVRVSAGSRFGSSAPPGIRLAYSFNPPDVLAAAGRRLADAWPRPLDPAPHEL